MIFERSLFELGRGFASWRRHWILTGQQLTSLTMELQALGNFVDNFFLTSHG